MARAPMQVLIIPYRWALQSGGIHIEYAVFSRTDSSIWQFLSGGAEDQESALEAAKREAYEEAGIAQENVFLGLDTRNSIPVFHFSESRNWGEELFVVPEHCFAVDVGGFDFQLSIEHKEFQWLSYAEAFARLTYDGNRTALWELNQKLLKKGPRD